MDADVRIRLCTLTIRGREGWGWGTDQRHCLDPALSAIEQAVQRMLDECALDPDLDVQIVQPVRLAWRRDGTLIDEVREIFVEQVRRAADAAQPARPVADEPPPTTAQSEPNVPLRPAAPTTGNATAPAHLLAEWSRSGRLPQIVAGWPSAVVSRWLAALRAAGAGPGAVQLAEPAVAAIADVVLAVGPSPQPQLSAEAALLVLIGALTAAAGDQPLAPATLELATGHTARAWPAPASTRARPPAVLLAVPQSAANAVAPGDGPAPSRTPAQPSPLEHSDRLAAPGLPFLVLVQLSRIGYLDAMWASAVAAGEPLLAQLVAAGLTGKALPPPDRGWRRRPTEAQVIAIAARLPIGAADELAHALRDELALLLPPLESALVALYSTGRATGDEVVVSATPHGVICGETAGALPIAWLTDRVDAVLDQLGQPPRRPDGLFTPLAAGLAPRRAYPHLDLAGLERHFGAAVGTALGSLAQELWGTDLPNAPLLALDRMGDLEVQLRPGTQGLAVAIPRGQRWLDLRRIGLLDRWAIPWAPAGYWELVTW